MNSYPLYAYPLLLSPARVHARLRELIASGAVDAEPNTWQLCLASLRMWHRLVYRSNSIGTSTGAAARAGWRAQLFKNRALRLPALLAEGAVAPWDFTGLFSRPSRTIRHLLAAHHDRNQFVFDLELLSGDSDGLAKLVEQAAAIVDGSHSRASWLRDLVVFEGYHESLLQAAQAAARGQLSISDGDASDPDLTLIGLMRWCASAPATPRETLDAVREGTFSFEPVPVPATAPSDLSAAQLAERLCRGRPVRAEELAGYAFRGVSLGLPDIVDRLMWKTFAKVFVEHDGGVHGFNLRIDQAGASDYRPKPGKARFGEFAVSTGQRTVLDYGAKNPPWSPLRALRDTLVVTSEEPLVLLGRSHLRVAGRLVNTPSYFTLERAAPLAPSASLSDAHLGLDSI